MNGNSKQFTNEIKKKRLVMSLRNGKLKKRNQHILTIEIVLK